MGVLVPPSLFGFPAFKSRMRYRKKAGDTPESTPSKPKEEKPKSPTQEVPPESSSEKPPERQYAKIVPANYDPATDPDYQDDELRQRMQEAIDRSNRKPTQQFAGRTAEDYPTLSEEQRVSRERRPVSFSDVTLQVPYWDEESIRNDPEYNEALINDWIRRETDNLWNRLLEQGSYRDWNPEDVAKAIADKFIHDQTSSRPDWEMERIPREFWDQTSRNIYEQVLERLQEDVREREGIDRFQKVIQQSEGFIRDIKQHPNDASARLIWADWLEENEQEDYADVIRLHQYLVSEPRSIRLDQREKMVSTIQDLCESHPEWFGAWGWSGVSGRGMASMDRGLLDVRGSVEHFYDVIQNGDVSRERLANVEKVTLWIDSDRDMTTLLQNSEWIQNVSSLTLRGGVFAGWVVRAMERLAPNFGNLSKLSIEGAGFDDSSAIDLARSENVSNLRSLNLQDNAIGPDGVSALVNSPYLRNLEELHLDGNNIGELGIHLLIGSPYLRNIQRLSVSIDNIHSGSVQALQRRFPGDVLELYENEPYENHHELLEPLDEEQFGNF